ncbi:HlyD family efflux transporter periplasmic adaptor subunit [Pseudomonas viridiflava]|uniref:efflux RND transporter periplasmic adaptor subunit n=1 Tax=Pseudomonas viridiflava TaxID=33069 RepID=UPI00177F1E91|nr:HlyD family efflux transporter periplasmic adaptor subunit [Pseudomonas viridiflava]MBD8186790.1 HlyD family efflux transporter periplasmic adaptor subunit [Pseudomonas viridiflava]
MTKYLARLFKVRGAVWIAMGIVSVGFLLILGYGLQSRPDRALTTATWIPLQPQPLQNQLGLVGRIEAASRLTLAAPFQGVVQAVDVVEGQRVERGQRLLTLDTSQLDIIMREALAAQLKLQRTVQDLNNWTQGEEVARARRSVTSAQYGLSDTERKLTDTKRLLERGIVARMEVDALEQQARVQRLDVAATESELHVVLQKGVGENRQIAEMELANAQSRYQALLAVHARRELVASFAGIVLRPQKAEGGPAPMTQQGMRVTEGSPLFELASLEQIRTVARVEEADLHQLAEGMPVQITGDGFQGVTLQGSVTSVAAQGEAAGMSGGGATYEVVVSVAPLTPEEQRKVRLGMSSRLAVVTYHTDSGFALPAEALQRGPDGKIFVMYRAQMAEQPRRVAVTTGHAVSQGVEVFGVQAGYVELPLVGAGL